MTRWMSTPLALGLLAGASAPAFAECPGRKVSADAGTSTPEATAETVLKPVMTDEKG